MLMATQHTTLAQQLVEAWNTRDPKRVLAVLTADHVYEDVTFGVVTRGPAETRQFFERAYAAFPDLHFAATAEAMSAAGGTVEWTMTGTHQGDLPGMPATGKAFAVRGATVFESAGGHIRSVRDYWDAATLLRQLGLLAEPATA
jgi:steroid delta-isomerase-like uncharacterized protein